MKRLIFVSELVSHHLKSELEKEGKLILIKSTSKVYDAIATHADIQLLPVGNQLFIDSETFKNCEADISDDLISNIHVLDSKLGNRYPLSVPFNGKVCKNVFIHHLDYTQPQILDFLRENNFAFIHTNQGYAGCSLLMLSPQKGITSDEGLAKELESAGVEVLRIAPGHIQLRGMNHGFIGGCCGVVGNRVFVNGRLNDHPQEEGIRNFILEAGFSVYEDQSKKLEDIGSILCLEVE